MTHDPLKPPTGSGNDFEQHPPGSYMAVCADVYVKEVDNYYFGKQRDPNDPSKGIDDRKTVTKAFIVFLTSHPDKQGRPSYVNTSQSFTWGGKDKPSNLFKLVKAWFPTGTPDQIRNMSLSNLIGKQAWITVEHNKNGYASVTAASTPPPGMQPIAIPADFKRREQKLAEQAAQVTSEPKAAYVAPAQHNAPNPFAQAQPVMPPPADRFPPMDVIAGIPGPSAGHPIGPDSDLPF